MLGLAFVAATAAPAAPPANPDPRSLAVPAADQARAKSLVAKLGSRLYDDREQAQAALAEMGRLAIPALTEGLTRNPSAEVRSRCQVLYPRARADDVQARLESFAADTAGKFEHDLPGWDAFQQLTAGCGPAARAVFVEIATSPIGRELVIADLAPQDLGARIAARRQEMYTRRVSTPRRPGEAQAEAPVADVLALLIAETRIPSRHIPRTNSSTVVYTMPSFVAALAAGNDRARVYRVIAGKWVATRDEALLMTQALTIGTTLELPETATLGARMMGTAGVTAISKASGAMAVAKVGNARHLPALESVFKDESVVRSVGVAVVGGVVQPAAAKATQLRDIALAAAILTTGQEPTDYGFDEQAGLRSARFQYTRWSIPAADRAAAFEKWAEWRAANPDVGKD